PRHQHTESVTVSKVGRRTTPARARERMALELSDRLEDVNRVPGGEPAQERLEDEARDDPGALELQRLFDHRDFRRASVAGLKKEALRVVGRESERRAHAGNLFLYRRAVPLEEAPGHKVADQRVAGEEAAHRQEKLAGGFLVQIHENAFDDDERAG